MNGIRVTTITVYYFWNSISGKKKLTGLEIGGQLFGNDAGEIGILPSVDGGHIGQLRLPTGC